jgi:AraC-like DNA-binding protein
LLGHPAASYGSMPGGKGVLVFDKDRAPDSPYVERVWRSHSEGAGWFVSIAESRAEIVVARHRGRVAVVVRGPETNATCGHYPPDGEWLGIRFKPGVYVLPRPSGRLVDRKVALPEPGRSSFWLNGSTWQVPDYDNADTFVEWLVRDDLLVIDPAVRAALHGELAGSSLRTLQRHFLRATGVTKSMTRRIERARYAALLLKSGVSIPDATHQAGYFDQPHLTRWAKQFIGLWDRLRRSCSMRTGRTSCRFCTRHSPSPGYSFV